MNKYSTKIGWFSFATAISAASFGQVNADADVVVDDANQFSNATVEAGDNVTINIVAAEDLAGETVAADQPENIDTYIDLDTDFSFEEDIDSIDNHQAFVDLDQDLFQANLVGYNATVDDDQENNTSVIDPEADLVGYNASITAQAAQKSSSDTVEADLSPAPENSQVAAAPSNNQDGTLPETGQADETYLNIAGSFTMAVATLTMAKFIFRKRA